MPEVDIQIKESEIIEINETLNELLSQGTESVRKESLFHRVHLVVNKLVQEAYELGKVIGDAGLD